MSLLKKQVTHKSLGKGKIVECTVTSVIVQFATREMKFSYPGAFKEYLRMDDETAQKAITLDLEKQEALEVAKKLQAELTAESLGENSDTKTNVAFKCTYCDGGASNTCIGFNGICTDRNKKYNINKEKHVWCSADDSKCRQFIERKISLADLNAFMRDDGYVCYESQMLRNWRAYAGVHGSGKRKGERMKLNKVNRNSLAVLTTRLPDTDEQSRLIFAVFLIDDYNEGDGYEEGCVGANAKYKIALQPQEAQLMPFWRYFSNENQPEKIFWACGLHRYFENPRAAQILKDIEAIKKGTIDEKLASEIFAHYCTIKGIDAKSLPAPDGALTRVRL